jgi:hypothetical protein
MHAGARQCQSSSRPLPGTHPDSEAFAAALARQKQAHACAAAEESIRCKQLQIRRENVCHARQLLGAILDGAFDKITAREIARFAVLQCADSAATQVESHYAESFARRCVWSDSYDSAAQPEHLEFLPSHELIVCLRHIALAMAAREETWSAATRRKKEKETEIRLTLQARAAARLFIGSRTPNALASFVLLDMLCRRQNCADPASLLRAALGCARGDRRGSCCRYLPPAAFTIT